MSIPEVASLLGGAALGAPFSEILKLLIEVAKKVKDFKPLSQDLAWTMERLVSLFEEIDSMQGGLSSGKDELKFLIQTIKRAEEMVRKCSRVQWYSIAKKASYTREIKEINQAFLRFCQIELQFIQLRNLLQSKLSMESLTMKIDLLSDREKVCRKLCLVPQPEVATIFWLDRPLRELKKMLFKDGVVTVVVSAPSACGKTTLVTKLCHDADVKGKFKQILFIAVSKTPNVRLIIQRLLRQTSGKANEFEKDLDARLCIKQLLKQLQQCGPILLVLDDVRPEEESLLEKFLIQFPHCKVLVTSRFEFPRLGSTYHLEPLADEDVKNLFIDYVPQPNCLSCTKHGDILQKIPKRCNGLPLVIDLSRSFIICDGCNSAIEDGRSVNVLGGVWHPECFCCLACHKPIALHECSNSKGKFHKSCFKKHRHPNSYVCKEKIPLTSEVIKYNEHSFLEKKHCPSYDVYGTTKCCSCERLKPIDTNYVMLRDGHWLCLECLKSTLMDTYKSRCLHFKIRGYFEALNMKIEKEFPLLLLEPQALNKAKGDETIDHHEIVIRGSCLSEERIISTVSRRPKMGPNGIFIDMSKFCSHVNKDTGVFIMYGLPRLLTGSISAHEMMHAWLKLNGYYDLKTELGDGLCQVIAHMWLQSQTNVLTDAAVASSHMLTKATNQPRQFDLVPRLLDSMELYKMQMEADYWPGGDRFSKVNEMVSNSSLHETMKSIQGLESVIDNAYHINTYTRRTNKVHEGITKFPFRCLVCFFLIIASFFLVKSLWSSM